jgi:hypothetical protein
MSNIRLSDSTYQRLLGHVTSFEDTPEDVITRLLDHVEGTEVSVVASPEPPRAAPGTVLPVRAYWVPILQLLVERGGAAPANDVIEALEDRMRNILTPGDFRPLNSGEIRWRNRARFARLRMKERGLMSDSSHRGVWEITGAGREFLDQEEKAESNSDGPAV